MDKRKEALGFALVMFILLPSCHHVLIFAYASSSGPR